MALTRITKGVIKPNENYDTHNINSTGIVTAVGANFTGNVSIGGTLTYEDVTSIDSVGIITAQKGIHVGAGLSVVGISTFNGATNFNDDVTFTGANYNVLWDKSNSRLDFDADAMLRFQENSFRIYNDGSGTSFIKNQSTNLRITSNIFRVRKQNDSDHYINCISDRVELYQGGNKKLETTAKGIQVGTGVTLTTEGNAQIAGIATFYNQINIPRYYGSGAPTGQYLEIGADEMVMYQRWNGSVSNIEFRKHSAFIGHTSSASGKTLTIQSGAITRFGYIQSNGGSGTYAEFNKANSGGYVQLYGTTGKVLTTGADVVNVLKDLDVDGHTDLDNVSIAGVSTFSGDLKIPTSMDSTESGGVAIQRFWNTGTITNGNVYKCGRWNEGEAAVQLLINVRCETGGHSGTATYLWQGGFQPIGGYGVTRLFPLTSGNGHGDGPDDGLNTGGFGVLIKQYDNYTFEVWVYVPSGKSNKALKVAVTELNRGNNFTDISASAAIPSVNAGYHNSLKTTAIQKLYFKDNHYAYFGDSQDLKIYHNGSHSYIDDTGSGNLYIQSNHVNIDGGGTQMANFYQGGAVELYHNNSLNFQTTTDGIQVAANSIDLNLRSGTASATGSGQITFDNVDGNGQPRDVVRIIGASHGNGGYGELKLQTAFNNTLYDRLTIDENGDMGLGGSPITSGYTSFTIHEPGTGSGSHVRFNMTTGNTGNTGSDGFSITVNASTNNIHYIQREAADMAFQNTGGERLRIKSDGKIGIGNFTSITPSRAVHIHEPSSAAVYATITNSSTGTAANNGFTLGIDSAQAAILNNYSNTPIITLCNGSERLRIDANGNMALGKGSSTSTNYGRNFQIHSTNTSGAALHLTNSTSGSSNSDGFHLVQQTHLYHWLREDAHQIFATNGAERLRILSNGNVLIGTTSDSTQKLTLYGTNAAVIYQGANTGTGSAQGFITGNNGNVNAFVWNYENGFIHFGTNGAERMRISSDGKLAVGTNTPFTYAIATFESTNGIVLQGSSQSRLLFRHTGGGTDLKLMDIQSSNGVMKFRTLDDNTTATDRMVINSNGNIGIGTAFSSPSKNLHVLVDGVGQGIQISNKESLYPAASTGYSDLTFTFRDYLVGGHTLGGEAIVRGYSESAYATHRRSALIFMTSSAATSGNATGSATEKLRITSYGSLEHKAYGGNNKLITQRTDQASSNNDIFFQLLPKNVGGIEVGSLSFQRESAADDAYLAFKTRNTGGSLQERLRIHSDGSITQNYANPQASSTFRISKSGAGVAELRFDTATANTASLMLGTDEELIVRYGPTEKVRFLQHQGVKMMTNAGSGVGYQTRTQIYPYWTSDTGACRFNITMVASNTIATPRFWIFTNAVTNQTGTVTIGMNGRTNSPNNARWRYHQSMWQVAMYGEGDNEGGSMRYNDSFGTQKGNATISSGGQYYVHFGHSERGTNANQYQDNYGGWYWHVDTGAAIQAHSFNFDCFFTSGATNTWYAYIDD